VEPTSRATTELLFDFNRAFEFHIDPNTTTTTTTTRMSRRAAWVRCASNLPTVMMYNEGLAYHILAQRDDSPVLFNAALQYYLQSYNSMVQQSSVFQYDSEMDILFMALTNNMGRCFGRLHDIGRMMWCYNELLAMYSSSTNKHNLTKEEQEFFQQRILHGNDYQLRPSAAA
jgi:hypothetical protein